MEQLLRYGHHRHMNTRQAIAAREKMYRASTSVYTEPESGREIELSTLFERGLLGQHLGVETIINHFSDVYREVTGHTLAQAEIDSKDYNKVVIIKAQEKTGKELKKEGKRATKVISVRPSDESRKDRPNLPSLDIVLKLRPEEGTDRDRICIEYDFGDDVARAVAKQAYLDFYNAWGKLRR